MPFGDSYCASITSKSGSASIFATPIQRWDSTTEHRIRYQRSNSARAHSAGSSFGFFQTASTAITLKKQGTDLVVTGSGPLTSKMVHFAILRTRYLLRRGHLGQE